MFTSDDLTQGILLNDEIAQLITDIAVLNKIKTSWTTNYPDATTRTKMVFHYQKVSGASDLELVELVPSSDIIATLVTSLNSIITQLGTVLSAKQAEFSQLGGD